MKTKQEVTRKTLRRGGDGLRSNRSNGQRNVNQSTPPLVPDELEFILSRSRPTNKVAEEPSRPEFEIRTALSRYLADASAVPLLTVGEEIALAARIQANDEVAREHMIRANLRLVIKIARDYEGLGVPLLDLINEGNMGLMKAVEKFDPSKGGKLSTYGSWWIKQSVRRAIANQSKTVRLPIHLVDKISKMRRAHVALTELFGREPSEEELAEEMGTNPKKIRLWRRSSLQTASLDAPLGHDEFTQLGDVVHDEKIRMPGDEMAESGSHDLMLSTLNLLDSRELKIIQERFALSGGESKTLDEIGVQFGLTRERIRQLQNVALSKLRKGIEAQEAMRAVSA